MPGTWGRRTAETLVPAVPLFFFAWSSDGRRPPRDMASKMPLAGRVEQAVDLGQFLGHQVPGLLGQAHDHVAFPGPGQRRRNSGAPSGHGRGRARWRRGSHFRGGPCTHGDDRGFIGAGPRPAGPAGVPLDRQVTTHQPSGRHRRRPRPGAAEQVEAVLEAADVLGGADPPGPSPSPPGTDAAAALPPPASMPLGVAEALEALSSHVVHRRAEARMGPTSPAHGLGQAQHEPPFRGGGRSSRP